jgi:hypothetical protein
MKKILTYKGFINESDELKGSTSGPSKEVTDFLNQNLKLGPKDLWNMPNPGNLGLFPEKWEWNPKTQRVDVKGIVSIDTKDRIPPDLKFGVVTHDFYFKSDNPKNSELESIDFTPRESGTNMCISHSHLKTLKGCTPIVKGTFNCNSNKLTSLEGSPKGVAVFICMNNPLSTLKGISPTITHQLYVYSRKKLQTLKDGPTNITGDATVDGIYIGMGMWGKMEGWIQAFKKLIGIEPMSGYEIESWFQEAPEKYDEEYVQGLFGEDDEPRPADKIIAKTIPNRERKLDIVMEMIPTESKQILDSYMKQNPMDMDLLDGLPKIKSGFLQRTGMKDISDLARSMRRGII